MWIKAIHLKNWSAYEDFTFAFPRQGERRNVVLIGAKNKVGKTRLLEAVTLCLFGDASTVQLVRMGDYPDFLRRALRKNAAPKASARVDFEDDHGRDLSIERVWHFANNSARKFKEEEVQIWADGKIISTPGIQDKRDFQLGVIAQRFLPPSLAPYFFFDSAHVQKIAGQEHREQVKGGIEGVLGVPFLRELKDDLGNYASKQARDSGSGQTTAALQEVQKEIDALQKEEKNLSGTLDRIAQDKAKAEGECSKLLDDFGNIGGEDMAKAGEKQRKKVQLDAQLQATTTNLDKLLIGDFALALTGEKLLADTADRLSAEILRSNWEKGKKAGEANFSKFVEGVQEVAPKFSPPLTPEQSSQLTRKLEAAWDRLWNPPPDGVAPSFLHAHLEDAQRADTHARLRDILRDGVGISAQLAEIDRLKKEIRALDTQISGIRVDNIAKAKQLRENITKCQSKIAGLAAQHSANSRALNSTSAKLNAKKQERARLLEQIEGRKPQQLRAANANKVAQMIEKIIDAAHRPHVKEIAKEMTAAYLAMANDDTVSKIEIADDCSVKMLTAQGDDIQELDKSLGESQIFTLALISAIVTVSKNRFPFIIDTPLANLDATHRKRFLTHYSSLENQVILLSTNTEVRQEEYALIRRNLAATRLIEREKRASGDCNVCREGYFPGIGEDEQ